VVVRVVLDDEEDIEVLKQQYESVIKAKATRNEGIHPSLTHY
jgi:hypothetical protein